MLQLKFKFKKILYSVIFSTKVLVWCEFQEGSTYCLKALEWNGANLNNKQVPRLTVSDGESS